MSFELAIEAGKDGSGIKGNIGARTRQPRFEFLALARGEDGQVVHGRIRVGHDRFEHRLEMMEEAADHRALEKAGPVFHLQSDALVRPLHDAERELEGRTGAD